MLLIKFSLVQEKIIQVIKAGKITYNHFSALIFTLFILIYVIPSKDKQFNFDHTFDIIPLHFLFYRKII